MSRSKSRVPSGFSSARHIQSSSSCPAVRTMFLLVVLSVVAVVLGSNPEPLYPTLPIEIKSGNEDCRRDSQTLGEGLNNNSLWAYKMWESSVKQVQGVIQGELYNFGHYDECLSVREPIRAQYCLVNIQLKQKNNFSISDPFALDFNPYESVYKRLQYTSDPNKIRRDKVHVGLCVPYSCGPQDVQEYLQDYLKKEYNNSDRSYEISIEKGDCQDDDKYKFDKKDIAFCCLVAVLVFIVIGCTYTDFTFERNGNLPKSKRDKMILCFSIRDNINDLNKIEVDSPLNVMYFVRIFMMGSIISGHRIVIFLIGAVYNFETIEKENRSIPAMVVCRGEVLVDIFFLFSGLLVTYSYLAQSEKRYMNPVRSIVLRYFRLAPLFAIITFFYATVYYKMGSGPLWNELVGREVSNCQSNWWTNILLVNNYVNVENLCILQAWYLPCDFHFFILAIPMNALIKRNSKTGLTVLGFLLGLSILSPFLVTYLGKKDPVYFMFNNYFKNLRLNDVFQTMYIPTHTRAAPYIIGMFLGYTYYKLKSSTFAFPKVTSLVILTLGAPVMFACMLVGAVFYDPYREYNILEGALYAALHRPVFALTAGVSILVISHGTLSTLSKILTWYPFIVLGKLTFGGYMVHMAFQIANIGSEKSSKDFTTYQLVSDVTADIVVSLAASFVLFLLVENPFNRLMKIVLPCGSQRKPQATSQEVLTHI